MVVEILDEAGLIVAMVLFMLVIFPLRCPSWVLSYFKPIKNEVPLLVTFPFIISSRTMEIEHRLLSIFFVMDSEFEKPKVLKKVPAIQDPIASRSAKTIHTVGQYN